MVGEPVASANAPPLPVLGAVERAAWRVPLRSRSFFLVVAAAAAVAVLGAGTFAAVVASRNAEAVADARDRSLSTARSVTEFRTHLGEADGAAATPLVSGEVDSPLGRSTYETELLGAGLALTDAGLAASGDNAEGIAAIADGLVRYAGLVETSRAYPVGSTFADRAHAFARDELVPQTDGVRQAAEHDMTEAIERASGVAGLLAIAALAVGLAVLVAAAALVAGRTRRIAHPALIAAAALFAGAVVVTATGLWSQRDVLRAASGGEIDTYLAANTAAFTLFDMRVDEMDAVASLDETERFDRFHEAAGSLVRRLDEGHAPGTVLLPALRTYVDSVGEVETAGTAGDAGAALDATLDGASAVAYRDVRGIAANTVARSATDVEARLDAAAAAGVAPAVPLASSVAAAGLAVAGVLARGRRYR